MNIREKIEFSIWVSLYALMICLIISVFETIINYSEELQIIITDISTVLAIVISTLLLSLLFIKDKDEITSKDGGLPANIHSQVSPSRKVIPADKIAKLSDEDTISLAIDFTLLDGDPYFKSEKTRIEEVLSVIRSLDDKANNYDKSFRQALDYLIEVNVGVKKREAFFANKENKRKVEYNNRLLNELKDLSE